MACGSVFVPHFLQELRLFWQRRVFRIRTAISQRLCGPSVIAVFSWLIVLFSGAGKGLFTIESRSLVFLILSGLATGFSWLCYFRALSLGNVNKVVAVDKLSTVLAVIAAFLFLQEPVSWYAWGGAVLLTAGTLLMIQKKEEQKRGGGRWLLYALLSRAVCGAYVYFRKDRR